MSLIVNSVSKAFGRFPALAEVSLEARQGEFLALLGPSGSGKTTLLRILAGLETPDGGAVTFDDEDLLALSARERRVGMVFQHYALFRHMTVARNIAFGLSVRPRATRPSKARIASRVGDLLKLVQLEGLETQLSLAAVRRPAPAGRPGPGPGHRAADAVAGRTVRGARRQGPPRPASLVAPGA